MGSVAVMRPNSFVDFGANIGGLLFTKLFHFQAGGLWRRPNLALVFCVYYMFCIFCYGCVFGFVLFDLGFSVLSQEIGWEERLRSDLFCWVGCNTLT